MNIPTSSITPPALASNHPDQMALGGTTDAIFAELTKAEQIILVLLAVLTPEQKLVVHAQLDAANLSGGGMTRYHERCAAITAAGAA